MTKLNKALMASTAIAFATGLAMPASAQDPSAAPGVVASQKKVKVKLYGQIARLFGFVGDGESVTFKQGEHSSTSTRMGIDGRGKINKDISVRTRFEFNVQSGDTLGGDQFTNQQGSTNIFKVRHLDVIISSKKFGAVWVGRGDSASNGTAEVNLAPGISSSRLGGNTVNNVSQMMLLDTSTEPMSSSTSTVGRFFTNFDGASRTNRIRYDTPTFFGFKASVGLIDKNSVDAALRYKGKIAGTTVAGAFGYCHGVGAMPSGGGGCSNTTYDAVNQIDGSISVRLPMGLGGTFSGGTRWYDYFAGQASVDEPYNLQPSIFYTTKVTELGATTVEYAFQYTKNQGGEGSRGIGHMVSAVQKIDAIGGDYFVQFNYVDVDSGTTGVDLEPLWYFGGGFRQRF